MRNIKSKWFARWEEGIWQAKVSSYLFLVVCHVNYRLRVRQGGHAVLLELCLRPQVALSKLRQLHRHLGSPNASQGVGLGVASDYKTYIC